MVEVCGRGYVASPGEQWRHLGHSGRSGGTACYVSLGPRHGGTQQSGRMEDQTVCG